MELFIYLLLIFGYCIYRCISHTYFKEYLPALLALLVAIIIVIFSFLLFQNPLPLLGYTLLIISIPVVPIGVIIGIIKLIKKIFEELSDKKYSTLITTVLCITFSCLSFFTAKYFTEYQIQSGRNDIYTKIYHKGYTQGKNDVTEILYKQELETATNAIYQTAYDKGYADCKVELSKGNREQYNKGYEKGYDDASYIASFSSLEEAYEAGLDAGFECGYDECRFDYDIDE